MSDWTRRSRKSKLFRGIRGLDDTDSIVPRLATIGRLHKGGEMREKKRPDGSTVKFPGVDLDHFRFASERDGVARAFQEAYGEKPATINVYLPYPTADECFQTCCEEWVAGGLVHRCDGEQMTIWKSPAGVYVTTVEGAEAVGCPYVNGKPRTKKEPGCQAVGRLYVIIPELVQAGFVGPVVLVTTSKNDIIRIREALLAVEEERIAQGATLSPMSGILWTLRRVPEKVSTPGENGQRVRRSKHLVIIEPAVEWVKLRLEMARQAALPEVEEMAWLPAPPDWEDPTAPGREYGEVEAELYDEEEAATEAPGFAEEADEEPNPVNIICQAGKKAGWPGTAKALLLGMGYRKSKEVHADVEKHGLAEMCRRTLEFVSAPIPFADDDAEEVPF